MPPWNEKHLRRLEYTFERFPIYFVTACVKDRRSILHCDDFHSVAVDTWKSGSKAHLWWVGPYVIMPDHVHFFCRAKQEEAASLSKFVGGWKEWTAKKAKTQIGVETPLWQREFFDHTMRNAESLREKIRYVEMNPVRAGLTEEARNWPYSGNPDNWGTVGGD